MAKLVDCASILSLAFAVDAVFPAIAFTFRNTHERLTTHTVEAIRTRIPTFAIKQRDLGEFLKWVKDVSPGLRYASRGRIVLIAMFIIGAFISLVGLALSATHPQVCIANWIVWTFTIYALFLCPVLQIAFDRFMRWLEHGLMIEWEEREDRLAQEMVDGFAVRLQMRESDRRIHEIQTRAAEREGKRKIERMKRRFSKVKRALQRLFSIEEVKK
jgi:hypothetical protein